MLQPLTKRTALDILWPHSARGSKEIGFMMLIVLIGLACASRCSCFLTRCNHKGWYRHRCSAVINVLSASASVSCADSHLASGSCSSGCDPRARHWDTSSTLIRPCL